MTILNRPMNLPNETFGWLVAQVLAAETARRNSENDKARCEKEKSHA